MKYRILFLLLNIGILGFSQTHDYNYFPTMTPTHVLDEKLTNINFALSFRIMVSDYNGPLVRLRRSGDNAEQDFFHGDDDIIDIEAVNTWRSGVNVYIVIWYDQSGQTQDAIQANRNRQPRFYPVASKPYFKGDGNNDHLEIHTGLQQLTNNGVNGTVLCVINASRKNQHTFGVLRSSDRWSSHVNWGNNNLYFDPGNCCNAARFVNNAVNTNVWNHYSFIRTNTKVITRIGGVQKIFGNHTTGRCTRNDNFAIGWANGNQSGSHSTTSFLEFVMYKTDITATDYVKIENNSILFWGL